MSLLSAFTFIFLHIAVRHLNAIKVGILSSVHFDTDPVISWYSYVNGSTVTIKMRGPAHRWFGIGIGGTIMYDTYAFVVYADGNVTEWILGDHNAGELLPSQHNVTMNTVEDDRRDVIITRSRAGYSNLYYTFPNYDEQDVGIITAWSQEDDDTFTRYHGFTNRLSETFNYALSNETTPEPTQAPTESPTDIPSNAPSIAPTPAPSDSPTLSPTPAPTVTFENRYDLQGYVELGDESGEGIDNIELTIGIENSTQTVFITMTGSVSQWFAVGFGSKKMKDTYAIVILWTSAGSTFITDDDIQEWYLGDHEIGTKLEKSVTRKIQEDAGEYRRSVLVERSAVKSGDQYFDFSICNKQYNLIWAHGDYKPYKKQSFENTTNPHSKDRNYGTGTIRIEGDGFENCNWTQSISANINWCIISLMILLSLFTN